ncbi:hypothetical protein, partial [Bosea sp. (in: a-proteobacteria)]|uniref:hypothetical protein n=1 Tax=Bosea sp. (in: a-proteobacteria) TaxID=1871050 RepID=UPI0040346C0D
MQETQLLGQSIQLTCHSSLYPTNDLPSHIAYDAFTSAAISAALVLDHMAAQCTSRPHLPACLLVLIIITMSWHWWMCRPFAYCHLVLLLQSIQLYEMNVVRHGLMIVGLPFSGKTASYQVLADALTLMEERGQ